MNDQVKIGCEAKHIITGVTGIVTSKSESLNGSIQHGLKPAGFDNEGKTFDEIWIDDGILKRIGNGLLDEIEIVEPSKTDIQLGNTVVHFNGFEGVVTEKVWYFNGCVHFGIMPNTDDPTKMPDTKYVPCQYLHIKQEAPSIKTDVDENGGPSSGAPLRT